MDPTDAMDDDSALQAGFDSTSDDDTIQSAKGSMDAGAGDGDKPKEQPSTDAAPQGSKAEGQAEQPAADPYADLPPQVRDLLAVAARVPDLERNLAAVTERPLFTKTRQGTQVAAPPTGPDSPPAAQPAVQIFMVGFVNDGTRRSAILAFGDDPAEVVVAEGDEVVGMTIQKINPNSLILMADGEEITIKMFDQ